MGYKNKDIYLETSVIRSLTKHLDNSYIKDRCFTSTLTLLELITDLKNDFYIRRNCVDKIIANITVDWQFPEAIVADAFPLLKGSENREFDFQILCNMLRNSKSYNDYINEIEALDLKYDLTYFIEADKYHANNFVKASVGIINDTNKLMEKGLDSRTLDLDEPLIINRRKDYFTLHNEYRKYNEAWTIEALCDMYVKGLKLDETEKAAERLYDSYNGKIDFYVIAYSYYNISKISRGNVSSINDRTDLEHFLYLRNDSDLKISSNDKLIRSICNECWADKYISLETLISNI